MARGLADYYNPETELGQRIVDLTSVMTAITGIAPLDGRGRIVYFDTFKNGLAAYEVNKWFDAELPAVVNTTAEIPPACIKFNPGTFTGDGTTLLALNRYIYGMTHCGVDFSIAHTNSQQVLELNFLSRPGDKYYCAALQYNMSDNTLAIETNEGWITIDTLKEMIGLYAFKPFKLVADFENGYYKRLFAAYRFYDLSDYKLYQAEEDGQGVFIVRFISVPLADDPAALYLGHIILTTDEP